MNRMLVCGARCTCPIISELSLRPDRHRHMLHPGYVFYKAYPTITTTPTAYHHHSTTTAVASDELLLVMPYPNTFYPVIIHKEILMRNRLLRHVADGSTALSVAYEELCEL